VRALVLYGAAPTQDFPVAPSPEFMSAFQSFGEIARKYDLDSLRKVLFASELAWMPPNRPDIAPKLAQAWEGYTARLPKAKRVIIANGGHGAHFAQPDEFNRAVLEFLATVPPNGARSAP
jgi:hypothetical protein